MDSRDQLYLRMQYALLRWDPKMTEFDLDKILYDLVEAVHQALFLIPEDIGLYLRTYRMPSSKDRIDVYVVNDNITDKDLEFLFHGQSFKRFGKYVEFTREPYHYEEDEDYDKDFCQKHGCGMKTRPHPDPFQANEGGVVVYCPQCEDQAGEDSISF